MGKLQCICDLAENHDHIAGRHRDLTKHKDRITKVHFLKWPVKGGSKLQINVPNHSLEYFAPHFKVLGMRNLQCATRYCQKINNKVTMIVSSYFHFLPILSISRNPWKGILSIFINRYWHLVYLILNHDPLLQVCYKP